MAENSNIEWTDHTFNPWIGCAKVSPGCKHCYADQLMDKRHGRVVWGVNGTRSVTSYANWKQMLTWQRRAKREGIRRRVFCASLADIFEDWQGQMIDDQRNLLWWHETWVDADGIPLYGRAKRDGCEPVSMRLVLRHFFHLVDLCPDLDILILTKRPENIIRFWPGDAGADDLGGYGTLSHRKRENVWLGTSVEDQAAANERIPHLLKAAHLCRFTFLSCEPLLGHVDLQLQGRNLGIVDLHEYVDWVIAGGESGPHGRPMHPDWARSLRDQCEAAGVPFLFKQWGEWAPAPLGTWEGKPNEEGSVFTSHHKDGDIWMRNDGLIGNGKGDASRPPSMYAPAQMAIMRRVGKKAAGRLLDGVEYNAFPS